MLFIKEYFDGQCLFVVITYAIVMFKTKTNESGLSHIRVYIIKECHISSLKTA